MVSLVAAVLECRQAVVRVMREAEQLPCLA
jgi:hypothetical protein